MRYYRVFLPRPSGGDDGAVFSGPGVSLADAELVREGFNWVSCVFSVFWAIGHGLWLTALAMAAGLVVLVGVPEIVGLDTASRVILLAGYAIICGVSGNDLRSMALTNRGFGLVAVVAAHDRASAVIRFAERGVAPPDEARAESAAALRRPAALDLGPSPGFWS